MMRPLIAGNWKRHGLANQLEDIQSLAAGPNAQPAGADVLMCPPLTLIDRAVSAARGLVAIGGQNCVVTRPRFETRFAYGNRSEGNFSGSPRTLFWPARRDSNPRPPA